MGSSLSSCVSAKIVRLTRRSLWYCDQIDFTEHLVAWKVNSKASGYQLRYSSSSSFSSYKTKTISGSQNGYCIVNNLTPGKRYYYKVRCYKNLDGKKYYSSWSTVKSYVVMISYDDEFMD